MVKKTLLLLLAAASIHADVIDEYVEGQISGGFPGVNSLFTRLSGAQAALTDAISSFNAQNAEFKSYDSKYFAMRKNLRDQIVGCIKDKVAAYQAEFDNCTAQIPVILEKIRLDKNIAEGRLRNLQACTQAQINHLNADIAQIDANIKQIMSDYASVANMSDSNVKAAVTELNAIRAKYNEMVTQRTIFLSGLTQLLADLNAAENQEYLDLAAAQSQVCY